MGFNGLWWDFYGVWWGLMGDLWRYEWDLTWFYIVGKLMRITKTWFGCVWNVAHTVSPKLHFQMEIDDKLLDFGISWDKAGWFINTGYHSKKFEIITNNSWDLSNNLGHVRWPLKLNQPKSAVYDGHLKDEFTRIGLKCLMLMGRRIP